LKSDILKLCDSHGVEVTNFDLVDPSNPKLLINPEIGKTYECTVYVKNTSEWQVLHVRLTHNYEDLRIEPSYIESLRSKKTVKIRIFWRPFKLEHIEEKIKNHKVFVEIQNHCTVEVVSEIQEQEVKEEV